MKIDWNFCVNNKNIHVYKFIRFDFFQIDVFARALRFVVDAAAGCRTMLQKWGCLDIGVLYKIDETDILDYGGKGVKTCHKNNTQNVFLFGTFVDGFNLRRLGWQSSQVVGVPFSNSPMIQNVGLKFICLIYEEIYLWKKGIVTETLTCWTLKRSKPFSHLHIWTKCQRFKSVQQTGYCLEQIHVFKVCSYMRSTLAVIIHSIL